MLKIFLSSTFRDLAEYRSKILEKLNAAFKGVGMEQFIPDGSNSQEVCIGNLKKTDVVIFLISSYYGSLMDKCSLKKECKADCPMKAGTGKISYTHCEYKTTIAEGILHQTYFIENGWDALPPDIKEPALGLKKEIGEEYLGFIDIKNPDAIQKICSNLATKLIEWHTQDKLDFEKFCDREEILNELLENIDSKVEVWGVGGIGKTALIEVALLIQKLKGKRIITIGTSRAYASGSGFEDFRTKCVDEQYISDSHDKITIYDVSNAFVKNRLIPNLEGNGLIPNLEELTKEIMRKLTENDLEPNTEHVIKKLIEILSKKIRSEKNLILFIDDFHLATEDVVDMVKSVDHLILSSRKNTYIARKEIYLSGIDEEDRENLIELFSTKIPVNVMERINKIAEGHPVSTEILVRNYENIDFDKIKDFDLTDADDNQVKDFYKRVIKEIFSSNKQALTLLKDLAVLNSSLSNNIHRECVLNSYDIENVRKVFKILIDTGMIKKKKEEQGVYEFRFKHILDYLEDEVKIDSHRKAINYYNKMKELGEEDIDNDIEVLYHNVKLKTKNDLLNELLILKRKVFEMKDKEIVEFLGFGEGGIDIRDVYHEEEGEKKQTRIRRLIEVANNLKFSMKGSDRALVLYTIGELCRKGEGIERSRAEDSFFAALEIYKELAERNPEKFLDNIAQTEYQIGNLYDSGSVALFQKAIDYYTKALRNYEKLVDNKNSKYMDNIIQTLQMIDNICSLSEEEENFKKILMLYKEIAGKFDISELIGNLQILAFHIVRLSKNWDVDKLIGLILDIANEMVKYQPEGYSYIGEIKQIFGQYNIEKSRYEKAKSLFLDVLEIKKDLGVKKPQIAETMSLLGLTYLRLGNIENAEKVLYQALDIFKNRVYKRHSDTIAKIFRFLGDVFYESNKYNEAEKHLLRALEMYKDEKKVSNMHIKLGIFYSNLKRFEEAEKSYLKAFEIRRERFLSEKGCIEKEEESGEDIIMTYRSELEDAHQDFMYALYHLFTFYNKLKNFEKAESISQKIVDLNKTMVEKQINFSNFEDVQYKTYLEWIFNGYWMLVYLYTDIKRFEKAEIAYQEIFEYCDKILEIDPHNGSMWYNKACVMSLKDNKKESIKFLKKAIGLDKKFLDLAKTEDDFKNIKNSSEFKELIGE